jgi:energy-coupling factor transporter ATP-binding protein EcfA2
MSDTLLSMRSISKSFPGVHALDNVDFELLRGEVHALVGENGAGKSTLIKILSGVYIQDGGEILLEGRPISMSHPSDAQVQEQNWDTLHVVKDELYSEDNIDPLEYHHGPSNVLKYSQIVAPQAGDYYIRKHVHSAFFDTRLDTLLRNLGCKTLVCVGFALDMCLGNTMIDALWRNYRVLLLRDCTFAIEIPGIDAPGAWTDRWILYAESAIGYTATSETWIAACQAAE